MLLLFLFLAKPTMVINRLNIPKRCNNNREAEQTERLGEPEFRNSSSQALKPLSPPHGLIVSAVAAPNPGRRTPPFKNTNLFMILMFLTPNLP